MAMLHARIDISQDLDGEPVVFACLDLDELELAASAHAVAATVSRRFRTAGISADDVLELRELTALADELAEQARRPGIQTVVLRPARISLYRDALERFVETHDEAGWIRAEDRVRLACVRELLHPLEDLCADALRAALTPASGRMP